VSMSNNLCDACGTKQKTPLSSAVIKSTTTDRLWCGKCREEKRQEILAWIYNENRSIDFGKNENTSSMNYVAPIHRPSWDDYYLGIAKAVSARGDCVRRQHGAVIVKNHSIVSTGYNGSPPGSDKSCGATGQCPRNLDPNSKHGEGSYDLCWATHAEANALLRASWEDLQGSTIYITGDPCPGCAKLIKSAGIDRVVSASL
jgi:dCMP deaminase